MSRTYEVRTYGCQMNVHDSERLAGLLEQAGYTRAADDATPDLIVFNTCAVRENADNRLYGNLGHLRPLKQANPHLKEEVSAFMVNHADMSHMPKDSDGRLRSKPCFNTKLISAVPPM